MFARKIDIGEPEGAKRGGMKNSKMTEKLPDVQSWFFSGKCGPWNKMMDIT